MLHSTEDISPRVPQKLLAMYLLGLGSFPSHSSPAAEFRPYMRGRKKKKVSNPDERMIKEVLKLEWNNKKGTDMIIAKKNK